MAGRRGSVICRTSCSPRDAAADCWWGRRSRSPVHAGVGRCSGARRLPLPASGLLGFCSIHGFLLGGLGESVATTLISRCPASEEVVDDARLVLDSHQFCCRGPGSRRPYASWALEHLVDFLYPVLFLRRGRLGVRPVHFRARSRRSSPVGQHMLVGDLFADAHGDEVHPVFRRSIMAALRGGTTSSPRNSS